MRIAITGATGNVGTALLRRLASEPQISVVGFARRLPDPQAGPPYDRAEWHSVDIGDPNCVDRLAEWFTGADVVIHLAWQNRLTYRRPWQREVSLRGSSYVFDAVVASGVPALIHASSSAAYAPGPKDHYVDESWPVTGIPESDYSIDKATVELALDGVERSHPGLRVVRLRPALTLQREFGAAFTRHFVGPAARFVLRRVAPFIPAHKRQRIQVVHADDVADAYLRAALSNVRGAFNIAAEPVIDATMLADATRGILLPMPPRAVRALADATWRLGLQPAPPSWARLADSVPLMDCSRAERELGWRARHDARDTLHEMINGITTGAGAAAAPLRRDLSPVYH